MGGTNTILIPKSLDFKPLQTKVRILPWHTNSIFIIVLFLRSLLTLPQSHKDSHVP